MSTVPQGYDDGVWFGQIRRPRVSVSWRQRIDLPVIQGISYRINWLRRSEYGLASSKTSGLVSHKYDVDLPIVQEISQSTVPTGYDDRSMVWPALTDLGSHSWRRHIDLPIVQGILLSTVSTGYDDRSMVWPALTDLGSRVS